MNNFKLILPRPFLMGTNKVLTFITKPYEMQVTPMTQEQYVKIIGKNPSNFKGKDLPVEQVSWLDVQEFIKKCNKLNKEYNYRLPTEAEWEYAAGCGLTSNYFFGDNEDQLHKYAHFNSGKTIKVGSKLPNYFGLYDIYGNVWEWTEDWYDEMLKGGIDPKGPSKGSFRVLRGGSWFNVAQALRSAYRNYYSPESQGSYLGFRLVRTKL